MNNTGRKTVKGTNTSAPMVAKSSARSPRGTAKTSTDSSRKSAAPTHEQIAMRSFEIYLSRGAAAGHELEDWYQAVRELQG